MVTRLHNKNKREINKETKSLVHISVRPSPNLVTTILPKRLDRLSCNFQGIFRCLVVHLTLKFCPTAASASTHYLYFYLALQQQQLQILTRLNIRYELVRGAVTKKILKTCTTWHVKEKSLKVSAYAIQRFRRSFGHKINKIANTKMHVSN